MINLKLAAAALALSVPVAVQAAPMIQVNYGSTLTIPNNNNFKSQLNGLGYYSYASTGASLILDSSARITYYFLGSESGFRDRFTAGSVTKGENSLFENHFAAPILIGSQLYAAGGSLTGLLNFTSNLGAAATVGQDGFGILLNRGQVSGSKFSTLYFGYDDQIGRTDDNHDDFIVMAQVAAVPEPGTWAMLIAGFVLVGSLLRRRRSNGITVLA